MAGVGVGGSGNRDSLINVFDSTNNDNNNATTSSNNNNNNTTPTDTASLTISVSSEATAVPTDQDQMDPMVRMSKQEYLESIFGPALELHNNNLSVREKIRKVLTSNYFHIIIIVLVLLDSFCVTVELVIDLESSDSVSESLQHVEETFKFVGLTILSLFVVELIFKLVFIREEFFKSKLEMFDAFIVVVSFILDIVFIDKKSAVATLGSIFVLFRFWRIIRIVNGIIMTVEKRAEAKIEKLKIGMNALIKEIDNLKADLSKKQQIINDLNNKIAKQALN